MADTKKKVKFSDVLAGILTWGGALGIVGWYVGKVTGVINTPDSVNLLPYFFGGTGVAGIALYCGRAIARLDRVEADVTKLMARTNRMDNTLISIATKLEINLKQAQQQRRQVQQQRQQRQQQKQQAQKKAQAK